MQFQICPTTAQLFVFPPAGASITTVTVSAPDVLRASTKERVGSGSNGYSAVSVQALSRGRCRVSITFSDGTTAQVGVVPVAQLVAWVLL